ncbi:MAG: DUF5698 domain-containing protein [Candidatus Cloacimonadales bacterium]|jgi:uncharacterized protein YebE (UPF0316 family)|nr:DUF5698 domain-containing protein [Candidatus Cloacimonadota bacterium]MDD2650790.1 DUF5698 domain-containing protein [Candidatus Cloacimonadota bacterium]MDD3502323.1 DUF5698 domain-containing protein [Candidatus Cloacimonadota bacterium]MDX9978006.1 DUF5698 domain-containing protein [Candidatus Cloacimonadales bacterium]
MDLNTYLFFPLLIVAARIMDVSLGTLRIILISKGLKNLAPIIGFFEVFIWIVVVNKIITGVSHPITYFAYALGYAFGTYAGLFLDTKLSLGKVMIRIIAKDEPHVLAELMRKNNIGATSLKAEGKDGEVTVLLSMVNRKELKNTLAILNEHNPNIFYTIEDIHTVNKGFFGKTSQNLKHK